MRRKQDSWIERASRGCSGPSPAPRSPSRASARAAQDSSPAATAAGGRYTIGVSNTVAGNGWREEMHLLDQGPGARVRPGRVAEHRPPQHRLRGPARGHPQPHRRRRGCHRHQRVGPRARSTRPSRKRRTPASSSWRSTRRSPSRRRTSSRTTRHEYARLGAEWLFETLGGEGSVFYMRGLAGHSADDDRDTGFQAALAELPRHHDRRTRSSRAGSRTKASAQMLDMIAGGQQVDGVWTSGIDNVIVDAYTESGAPLVPIVGADNAGFVTQLATVEGLTGAAVTNPGTVGGAASRSPSRSSTASTRRRRRMRRRGSSGSTRRSWPTTRPRARRPSRRPRTPTSTPSGRSASRSRAGPRTRQEQLIACVGPGE